MVYNGVMNEVMHNILAKMKSYVYIGVAGLALLVWGIVFNSGIVAADSVDARVIISDSLSIKITRNNVDTDNVTLDLDPATNSFAYQDLDVAVGTNNEAGYKLNISATSTNLTNTADSTKTIPTLGSGASISETDFRNCSTASCLNKWGFRVTSNSTTPSLITAGYIPFANTELLSNNSRTNNDTASLRFATKIDYTK